MQVRRVTTEQERDYFVEQYNLMTKMTVSPDYIKAVDIYGLYQGSELVGGFVLAIGSAMVWPKLILKDLLQRPDLPLERSAELNMVWANPSYKKSTWDTIRLWWAVCSIVARQHADYITFACEDTPAKKNLMSRYEIIASGLVYSGPINKYAGRNMKVWWSTPMKFRWMKILYIPEYARIAFRRYQKARTQAATNISQTA